MTRKRIHPPVEAARPLIEENPSLTQLKRQIALGEYSVDPGTVAEQILWKTNLVRRVRRDLTVDEDGGGHEADRSRLAQARRRFAAGARPRSRPRPGQ